MTKTNVQSSPSNSRHHDTPNNKTHVIKFRVTETEKMELQCTAKLLHLSLSTLIRRALHNAKIERTVVVAGGSDTEHLRAKILDELADLTAFRLSAEKVLGELYGNAQAYRLSRKGSCIVQP